MNRYIEGSDFQKKFQEKYGKEDWKYIDKKIFEVEEIDEKTVKFFEMFRENFFGEDNTKVEIFVGELMRQHRTHQQSIIKNFFSALKMYADKCNEHSWYDDRNKAAVDWAEKVTKEDFYFPCI